MLACTQITWSGDENLTTTLRESVQVEDAAGCENELHVRADRTDSGLIHLHLQRGDDEAERYATNETAASAMVEAWAWQPPVRPREDEEYIPTRPIDLSTGLPARPRVTPVVEKTRTRAASLTVYADVLTGDVDTWVGSHVAGCVVRSGRLCFGTMLGVYSDPEFAGPRRADTALVVNTKHRLLGLDFKPELRLGADYVERPSLDLSPDPVREVGIRTGAYLFVGRHITRSLSIEAGVGASTPLVGPVDIGTLEQQGGSAITIFKNTSSGLLYNGSVGLRFGGAR